MPRTTSFVPPLIASLLLAALSAPAWAAEEDGQLWTSFNLTGAVAPDVSAAIEVTHRGRGAAVGGDQMVVRPTLEYKLAPGIAIGGGVGYFDASTTQEIRPHQQLTISAGRLSFRTRLEERFIEGAERMELRLRQRAQASTPLAERLDLAASAEVFAVVRARRRPGGETKVDQWRFQLALRHRLDQRFDLAGGYMLILVPRDDAPDRVSHVPQIGLTLKL